MALSSMTTGLSFADETTKDKTKTKTHFKQSSKVWSDEKHSGKGGEKFTHKLHNFI